MRTTRCIFRARPGFAGHFLEARAVTCGTRRQERLNAPCEGRPPGASSIATGADVRMAQKLRIQFEGSSQQPTAIRARAAQMTVPEAKALGPDGPVLPRQRAS